LAYQTARAPSQPYQAQIRQNNKPPDYSIFAQNYIFLSPVSQKVFAFAGIKDMRQNGPCLAGFHAEQRIDFHQNAGLNAAVFQPPPRAQN